jgi:citrate lyase subunit beta/citryl-CoA lyase
MSRKLLRSALFCPADRQNILEKSCALGADVFIFDLEDAVQAQNKETSRNSLSNFVNNKFSSKSLGVIRINCPIKTAWGMDDLISVCKSNIHAVLLPKVECSNNLIEIANVIKEQRPSHLKKLPIWAMIETAKGVLAAESIAKNEIVECLVFGSNDLTKDIKGKQTHSREPLLFSMSHTILAARACHKSVLDGVCLNIGNNELLRQHCVQGKELGFDGKTLIHPNQIDITNDVYSPSKEDIQLAYDMINIWNESKKLGKSVAVFNNELVEELHIQQALELIEFDKAIKP